MMTRGLPWQRRLNVAHAALTRFERAAIKVVCSIRAEFVARPRTALALLSLLGTVSVAQAAGIQVNVDQSPKLCARFLADLRSDHIPQMTPGQLCRYDFLQRHAGKHYKPLDWKPAPGDPVALTVKIFNANLPPATNARGAEAQDRERAAVKAYAQEQERHHALSVEVAPITIAQEFNAVEPQQNAKLIPIHGYVLRSRGNYCGMADTAKDFTVPNATGRVLIAFYADKVLQQPIPDLGGWILTRSDPLQVDGGYFVLGLNTLLLRGPSGPVRDPGGPSYGAYLVQVGFYGKGVVAGLPRVMSDYSICDYKIYANDRAK